MERLIYPQALSFPRCETLELEETKKRAVQAFPAVPAFFFFANLSLE